MDMEGFLEMITHLNDAVNHFVWVTLGLWMLLGTGILMTLRTRCFQLTHFRYWMRNTIGSIFQKRDGVQSKDQKPISQFQAMCTALAATVGVGNIAGVASAIVCGGPGAVFWMWIAAFLGMMTSFSENVLGIYFRRKNKQGEWIGGAMYYLRDGLAQKRGYRSLGKLLAVLFACFCLLASFGVGNMSQVNAIAANMTSAFRIPALSEIQIGPTNLYNLIIGVILMILAGLVSLGGTQRIAAVTGKIVPAMVLFYLAGSILIISIHYTNILPAFTSIFKHAFGFKAAAGGAVGYSAKIAMTWGLKRGVFSNEAGLGSSVMVNAASDVKEPVKQGMWGIFEAFADTVVMCSLTALVILTSGLVNLSDGTVLTDSRSTTLVSEAFSNMFGAAGGYFIAIAVFLFAFSTVIGWSFYGTRVWEFLFGTKSTVIYKIIYVLFIVVGATVSLDLAWNISDTFNCMMMIPNLIGVLCLYGLLMKITKNYMDRKFHNKDITPMLSAFPEIQEEQAAALKRERT